VSELRTFEEFKCRRNAGANVVFTMLCQAETPDHPGFRWTS